MTLHGMRGGRCVFLAGLAVAAAGQPAMGASAKPQQLTVVMVDDRFIPDHLTFRAGIPYRLRLENHGKELHEFTAPAFFASARVADPHVLSNDAKEVVLQPGETKQLDLVATRIGDFDLRCADHDWDGMVGQIQVR